MRGKRGGEGSEVDENNEKKMERHMRTSLLQLLLLVLLRGNDVHACAQGCACVRACVCAGPASCCWSLVRPSLHSPYSPSPLTHLSLLTSHLPPPPL